MRQPADVFIISGGWVINPGRWKRPARVVETGGEIR